mmetsp:Transcript_62393/g.163777  ORF Transcript_62393/g.163777 Transcript_62393/m.163777 type:complete len:296 (-) Transcript_62393:193-1080(-)
MGIMLCLFMLFQQVLVPHALQLLLLVGRVELQRLDLRQEQRNFRWHQLHAYDLVQVEDEDESRAVHDGGVHGARLHQERYAHLARDLPYRHLRDEHDQEVYQLPDARHPSDLEFHKVELCPAVHSLDFLLVRPLGHPVVDPRLRLGRDAPDGPRHAEDLPQVPHDRDHEEEAAERAAAEALDAVLPRVHVRGEPVRRLREDGLHGVPREDPRRPLRPAVDAGRRKDRSVRPDAVRAVRALLNERPRVADVHLPAEEVPDHLLLEDHVQDPPLRDDVDDDVEVDLECEHQQLRRPA